MKRPKTDLASARTGPECHFQRQMVIGVPLALPVKHLVLDSSFNRRGNAPRVIRRKRAAPTHCACARPAVKRG